MIEFIRSWILGLAGAALVCAVATELTPKGPVKTVVRAVCGVVMAAALISPLFEFDFPAYALNLSKYRAAAEAAGTGAEISDALNRRVIEETLEAYILDKAQALGAEASAARVTVRWSTEGVWVPAAAEIDGPYNAALAGVIEGELGIAKAAQSWRYDAEP